MLTDYYIYDARSRRPNAQKKRKGLVNECIDRLTKDLSKTDNYKPISITDAYAGIDHSTFDLTRRDLRRQIKVQIGHGLCGMSVCLHVYSSGGSRADLLTIFKIPPPYQRTKNTASTDEHTLNFVYGLEECRMLAPNTEAIQVSNEVMRLLNTYAGINIKNNVVVQIRGIISADLSLEDKVDVDTLIENGYINADVLQDLRTLNSRGGRGGGHTQFDLFYDKCKNILRTDGGAEERRKAGTEDILYGSTVTSIPDLRKKAVKALLDDIKSGNIQLMPPIPSDESIRLQFVPNSAVVKAAGNMTGRLLVSRHIQLRTLRDKHVDQHWVNAQTKYHKEWIVDVMCMVGKHLVKFAGQDDKAKVPVGDIVPVSTKVHIKQKAIVPADDSDNMNKAADHDWSKANIIPSVTLLGNIPQEYDGSFYSGGEDGNGEIHVVLRDATFDASDVFDHSAQLYDILINKDLTSEASLTLSSSANSDEDEEDDDLFRIAKMNVLLLQTDGGPDHNLKFLRTKLALIALFNALGVDHLVALRGAPHGSYLNVVERCMSLLNLGLQNLALKRREMPDWAEEAVANAGSMNGVRKVVELIEKEESIICCSRQEMTSRLAVDRISSTPEASEAPAHEEADNLDVSGENPISGSEMAPVVDCSTLILGSGACGVLSDNPGGVNLDSRSAATKVDDAHARSSRTEVILQRNKNPSEGTSSGLVSPSLPNTERERNGHLYPIYYWWCQTFSKDPSESRFAIFASTYIKHESHFTRTGHPWMFTEWLDTTETEYNDTVNDLDKVEAESRRIAIAMNREKDIHVTERSQRLNDEVMKERSERKARSAGSIPPSLPYRMQARAEDMREQRIIPRELIDRTPRNLKKEWAKSMELPISQVSNRFAALDLNGRSVKVEARCPPETVGMFHNELKKIDPEYNDTIREASRLHEMPLLQKYMDDHVVVTPYSLSVQKCTQESCTVCTPIRAPEGPVRDLVLQRQPTPADNRLRPGHYYSRKEALKNFGGKSKYLTDLSCLPSKMSTTKDKAQQKDKKKRDTREGNKVSKWADTSVRFSLTCEECGKVRCLFSKNILNKGQMKELQKHIETYPYICGHLLFAKDSNHSLGNVVIQRINVSCADAIEKEYYNPKNNKRKAYITPVICALCTSEKRVMLNHELETKDLTGGYECLPMCEGCMVNEHKPAKKGNRVRKNLQVAKAQDVRKKGATRKKNNATVEKRKKKDEDVSDQTEKRAKKRST